MKIIKTLTILFIVLLVIAIITLYFTRQQQAEEVGASITPTIELTSSSFQPDTVIDAKYSCKGDEISPQLSWGKVPEGTQSLALIMMDYDAPSEHFALFNAVHWLLYNLSPEIAELAENQPATSPLPNGAEQGKNGLAGLVDLETGYMGPCPPMGTHQYVIRLYALDSHINLAQPNQSNLLEAMDGHILAVGQTQFLFGQQ